VNAADRELARRADALLDELLDLDPDARALRLDALDASEPALAALVRRLLEAATRTEEVDFDRWRRAAADLGAGDPRPPVAEPAAGERLGAWRIVAPLARGGMSRVFVAERVEGGFHQRAALKLFTASALDGESLARRFEQERQILAAIEHPNIARVLDGGVAPDGRPFLVLELVEGEPIDDWCSRRGLGLDARLELLSKVARTVQHAHRNLIVHRDLKPSNVMVTGDGTVKLLDFGIAKVLEGSSALAGVALAAPETRTTARPLTPAYASPEQIRGDTISTASDVYQLGLLLYELVAGRPAHVFREDSLRELERVVCEADPPRLARRAVTLTGTGERGVRIPADLETIVFKALQKDPARRYGSAEQLAEDLDRFLADEPVRARPDTVAYRVRKFVRRHRLAVGLSSLVAVLVAASAVALAFQARRLAAERDRARDAAARAEAVTRFVVGLFEGNDPDVSPGRIPDARELLVRGAERLESELRGQPVLLREMLGHVAEMNLRMFEAATAEPLARRALALAEEAVRSGDASAGADLARARFLVGWAAHEQGRYAEAADHYAAALAAADTAAGAAADLEPLVRLGLGRTLAALDRPREAVAEIEAAVRRFEESAAPDPVLLGNAWQELGGVQYDAGEVGAAVASMERALAVLTRAFGAEDPRIAFALNDLAFMLEADGQPRRAAELYRRAVDLERRRSGDASPRVATILHNQARVAATLGDVEESLELGRRALAMRERLLGRDHPESALTRSNLGIARREALELEAAVDLLEEAGAAQLAALGADHRMTSSTELNRALALLDLGRVEASRPGAEAARRLLENGLHRDRARAAIFFGRLAEADGRPAEALEWFLRGCAFGESAADPRAAPILEACLLARRAAFERDGSSENRARLEEAIRALDGSTPRLRRLAESARKLVAAGAG
jgi:serine/threonine-protein kinase